MSLCRWSSMDWKCDIYAYEAEDGIVIHVASNRYEGEIPSLDYSTAETLGRTYKAQSEALEAAALVPIGGSSDGQTFLAVGDDEAYDMLVQLRTEGYRFPDHVLEALSESSIPQEEK